MMELAVSKGVYLTRWFSYRGNSSGLSRSLSSQPSYIVLFLSALYAQNAPFSFVLYFLVLLFLFSGLSSFRFHFIWFGFMFYFFCVCFFFAVSPLLPCVAMPFMLFMLSVNGTRSAVMSTFGLAVYILYRYASFSLFHRMKLSNIVFPILDVCCAVV